MSLPEPPKFRKNQTVYLIRLDKHGLYHVVKGKTCEIDKRGEIYVRIQVETEPGKTEPMVVDTKHKHLYYDHQSALLGALAQCQEMCSKWSERAFELAKMAGNHPPTKK